MKGLLSALKGEVPQEVDDLPPEARQEPPEVISFSRSQFREHAIQRKDGSTQPLPASLDAEKGVLSSILLSPNGTMPRAVTAIDAHHFHHPSHRTVYEAVCDLWENGKPIDLVTVTQEIADRNELEKIGGPILLADLHGFLPTAANADYYIDIVKEKYALRRLISLADRIKNNAYENQHTDFTHVLESAQSELKSIGVLASEKIPEVVSVMDFKQANESSTLLGNRWLCRGGAALIIGSSGTGKSSSSMQQDLLWAAGQEAFGIRPSKPLKIVTIQAENDDGDMHEMREGVMRGMDLDKNSIELIKKNLLCHFQQSKTGIDFVETIVRPLLKKHRPDLIRIDPLAAYAGCDITQASESAALLRNSLNPLLTEYQCGLILVHHTPKTTGRDTKEWKPTDWMYSGAGSADIVNWARSVLVINPSYEPGKFEFLAAKRGGRIGWCNDSGEKEDRRFYEWAPNSFHWIPSESAPIQKPKSEKSEASLKCSPSDIIELLKVGKIPRNTKELCTHSMAELGVSRASFYRAWKEAKGHPEVSQSLDGRFIHITNISK